MFGIEALNTNVLIWGSFMSTTTKAAVHHGQNYTDILELYRNTKLRRAEFTRYHAEIDIGPSSRNSERIYDLHGKPPSRTRSTLTHDQVIKFPSTRLLSFRVMLGEDARAFRSESRMEKSTRRISTVEFLQRTV